MSLVQLVGCLGQLRVSRSIKGVSRSIYGVSRSIYGVSRSIKGVSRSIKGVLSRLRNNKFLKVPITQ